MDFASLMKSKISKSTTPPTTTSTSTDSTKKYLKRAELEAQRQEAYLREQRATQAAREEKLSKKRKVEEEEASRNQARDQKRQRLAEESRIRREEEEAQKESARRKRLGLPELSSKNEEGKEGKPLADGEEDIEEEALIAKLRDWKDPAVLFGETHAQRLNRYRKLIAPKQVLTNGPIPTTLILVPEAEMKVPVKPPPPGPERDFLFRQLASYFTLVLTEWEIALNARAQAVKESFQGKQAYGAMEQSRENMRPLFKRFERGELEESILGPVVEIVRASQERRYVDANDGYLTLSIGKA